MTRGFGGFTLVLAVLFSAGALTAQQGSAAHAHLGHLMEAFGPAPDGAGLLPTALAEARTAIQHATYAADAGGDLAAIKRHVAHVLHAVDPTEIGQGPGSGFGVKRAAEAIAQHINLAAGADGASDNIRTHAQHVAASARTVAGRADEVVKLVREIEAASSAPHAAHLVHDLQSLTEQLLSGRDATGDGRITWQEGEGGLEHVEQHMNLLLRGEG